ncbi:MAG TPA: hypothetical protein VGR37_02265 [Longimicrobiaceae bacterium]|nr:hypothetical protein [Longimicrobiaceae bacterium]
MRSFTDAEGRTWDVVPGRESWGTVVLLFSPRQGSGARTAPLASETVRDADQELAEMTEEALRERLAESRPWEG